ncbi:hypothetical protein ILYODFUR_018032 [Ilyodon furcidens]|uniref:EF-hand domain-containing protein n=1 Tax=Ilyodon furcidens TaxID=33524 RepID=A0ABV0T963_9TELE
MFEAEEDSAITETELAVILRTALGVTHLNVSNLFTAIDVDDTGKITFEKFRGFVEENPDFADDYLHTESVVPQRGPDHDTQTNPSTINLQGTANSKTANGICPDFSPKDHDGTVDALMKKHN